MDKTKLGAILFVNHLGGGLVLLAWPATAFWAWLMLAFLETGEMPAAYPTMLKSALYLVMGYPAPFLLSVVGGWLSYRYEWDRGSACFAVLPGLTLLLIVGFFGINYLPGLLA